MHLVGKSITQTETSLDQEIRLTQEELDSTKLVIDIFYDGVEKGLILPESQMYQCVLNTTKNEQEVRNSRDIVYEFYLNDSFPYFTPPEFEAVHQSFAFGLARYFIKRAESIGAKLNGDEDEIVPSIYSTIVNLYRDPRDFIFEYDSFKDWRKDPDPLKANAFAFWLDCIFHYSRYQEYLNKLQEAKDLESYVDNPFAFRREINELLNTKPPQD